MLVKILSLFLSIIMLVCLCGCALTENGYSLHAFCERINNLNAEYKLSPTGYIVDEAEKTLTKFFKFSQKEIMLQFIYDEDNRLTTLHIVFDSSEENNADEEEFIKNCIHAFIDDISISDSLLTEIDFNDTIYKIEVNTKTAKIGNTELLIDATDIGTVITVVKNNP